MSPPGHPKGECRSAQREGTPMSRRAAMGHEGAVAPEANSAVRSTEAHQ